MMFQHLVQRADNPSPTHPNRVSQRHSSTKDIETIVLHAQQLLIRQCDDTKRLVDFMILDIVQRHACLYDRLSYGHCRCGGKEHGCLGSIRHGADPGKDWNIVGLGRLFCHEHHGTGSIVQCTGVSSCYSSTLAIKCR